jgi:hypothetical protein
MNIRHQWLFLFSLIIFLSVNANAEVYKWTDKEGVVRYTDIPPPSNVKKYTTLGNKKAKEAVAEPKLEAKEGAVATDAAKPKLTESEQARQDMKQDLIDKKKRQQLDIEKQEKEKKEAEAKQKQANCAIARSNYQTYSQGGRIYQMNEKGERVYVDDQGLAEKAAQAQRDMQQYCN